MTAGRTDPRHPELGPTGPEFDTPEQEIAHLRKTQADLLRDLEAERARSRTQSDIIDAMIASVQRADRRVKREQRGALLAIVLALFSAAIFLAKAFWPA